jgi:iron complex outermembrane recepter protein
LPPCTTTASIGCLTDVGPAPGAQVRNPNVRGDTTSFFDDITRGYTQKALFGSVDFDIIPKTLTVTAGTRYYNIDTTAVGSSVSSFFCYAGGPPPCTGNIAGGVNNDLSAQNLNISYKGFKSRANLSWRPMDDVLLYFTWSQGFRPGGFNRGSHLGAHDVNGFAYSYRTPSAYAPDTLVNKEIGWKTQWLDRRLEFNGAVYQEDWKDVQVQIFESCCYGNLSFVTNGPNYRVRGAETEVVGRVTHGLTITGSASWNSSNLTNAPFLLQPNGQPIVIPVVAGLPNVGGSPFGTPNTPLAESPPFQASLRARYEFLVGDYKAFWQIAGSHQAHAYSATGNIQTYTQAGFTTYDAALGVEKDAWTAQFYGANLTDARANLFENGNQFVTAETINRPRTAGVKFSYKF